MTTTRNLTCCVCGSAAGRWQQHWNRDIGYGICRPCATEQTSKETPERMESLYGKPSINYEAPVAPMTRPDSPCIAICDTLYQPTHCSGCGRTIQEVANWVILSEAEKDAVWQRIETEGTAKRFTTYRERA